MFPFSVPRCTEHKQTKLPNQTKPILWRDPLLKQVVKTICITTYVYVSVNTITIETLVIPSPNLDRKYNSANSSCGVHELKLDEGKTPLFMEP